MSVDIDRYFLPDPHDKAMRTYRGEKMPATIVLGPVPCQGCRALVVWNGQEWIGWRGRHDCRANGGRPDAA